MNREQINKFHLRMEEFISNYGKEKAFRLITSELNECESRHLHELMGSLNYLRYEPVLDWIENNINRTSNINIDWGHLAASSNFGWERAKKWISSGRPLSLVSLDAIMFCTTNGQRLNQSPWMRDINPKLSDNPKDHEIATSLSQYLEKDNVPRTRNTINRIINNIFEVET